MDRKQTHYQKGDSSMNGKKKGIVAGMVAVVIAVIGIVCRVLRKKAESEE